MKPISLLAAATAVLLLTACAATVPPAYPKITAKTEFLVLPNSNTAAHCSRLIITGSNFPAKQQVQLAAVGPIPIGTGAVALPPTTAFAMSKANNYTSISSSTLLVLLPNNPNPPSGVDGQKTPACVPNPSALPITFAIVAFDPTLGYGASTTINFGNVCPLFGASAADVDKYCHPL
jgi:hypothetical protein